MSDIWEQARVELKGTMTPATYNDLINPIQFVSRANNIFTLGVTSPSVKERLENMPIGQGVTLSLISVVGGPVTVKYVLIEESLPPSRVAKEPPRQVEQDSSMMIRDHRKPGRYYIDNVFIRGGYAAKVGPGGIAVYNALVLHADTRNQDCWPSYNTIAKLCGMSKSQAIKKTQELEALHIIEVERRKKGEALNDSNVFTLLDDGEWGGIK